MNAETLSSGSDVSNLIREAHSQHATRHTSHSLYSLESSTYTASQDSSKLISL